jgi:hypothetical protein
LTLCPPSGIVAAHTVIKNTMRTKKLLAAAAIIAVGASTSMAQGNVYSLNVVGYVNRIIPEAEFALISNPLAGSNNLLSSIIPNPPDGTSVFRWNEAAQDLDEVVPTFFEGLGWAPDVTINPGEAFFALGGARFYQYICGRGASGCALYPDRW